MIMNKEFSEITNGFRRTLRLMEKPEKTALVFASFLMLITGVLTNLPAVILGRLVDKLVGAENFDLSIAIPFIALIIGIILVREALTVVRKYFVENVATQTDKKQTVNVIEHLLKTDIANINQQQIGSLHGRIFKSIQGMIKIIKLGFLDFFPVFFSGLAAIAIALTQKPLLAGVMVLVIPVGLFIIVWQVSSQKGIRVALLRGKEKIDGAVVEMLGGNIWMKSQPEVGSVFYFTIPYNPVDKENRDVEVVAFFLKSAISFSATSLTSDER